MDSERSEGRNFTEECAERTGALQTCMEAHREYYEDFLFDSEAAAAAATAALADGASGEAGADGGEAAAPQTPEQPDGGAAGEHGAGGSGGKGPEDAGGGRDEPKDTPDPESEGGAADGAHVLQLLPCVLCVLSGAASCSCMLPHTGAPLFLVRIFGGHPSCSRLRQRGSARVCRRTMAGLVGTQQVLLQRFQWAARPTEACAHAGAPQPVQNNSAPEDSKAGASMGGAFPAAGGLMKAVDDAPAEASSAQVRGSVFTPPSRQPVSINRGIGVWLVCALCALTARCDASRSWPAWQHQ